MLNLGVKVKDRLSKGVKKFQPILAKAKAADINESDTVTIITDMLCEVFGYDKYENITSEFAIKKTFCDLAIKLNGTVPLLLECKAAGIDLKDDHARQATNYAADSGIEWVVLTNGLDWKVYKIVFAKPIDKQLVYEFNFCELSPKKQSDLEMLYYLSIEAFAKSTHGALEDLHEQKQVINRYMIGRIMLTAPVLDAARKTVRKLYPGVKVDNDELCTLLTNEVFKREIIEGDAADDARKKVQKAERAAAVSKAKKNSLSDSSQAPGEE